MVSPNTYMILLIRQISLDILGYIFSSKFARKFTHTLWGRLFLVFWVGKTLAFYFLLLRRVGIFCIVSLASITPLLAQEAKYLQEAQLWYNKRSENIIGTVASNFAIDKAIDWYSLALKNYPHSESAAEGLLKSYYFKVSFTDHSDLISLTTETAAICKSLEQRFPKSGGVLYWSASLWARWAEHQGIIKSCYEGVADRIRDLSERVIKHSPDYRFSGGYRLSGLIHLYSPRIPLVLNWSSKDYSEKCLEFAARKDPEHLGNLMGLAKIYIKREKYAEAKEILDRISDSKPRKSLLLEDIIMMQNARNMASTIESKI